MRADSKVKKILLKISKFLAVLYVWICSIKNSRKHYSANRVLIILCGNIGDVLLDSSAWISLERYYRKLGYIVLFTGSDQNWRLFQMVSGYTDAQYINTIGTRNVNKTPLSGMMVALRMIRRYEFNKVVVTIPEYDFFLS